MALADRFTETSQPRRRGRPPSPSLAMMRCDRIAWRGLPDAMRLIVARVAEGNLKAAVYLIDRCLGTPTQHVAGSLDVRNIAITAEDIAAALRALRTPQIAAPQAQDTATDSPQPAVSESTPEVDSQATHV